MSCLGCFGSGSQEEAKPAVKAKPKSQEQEPVNHFAKGSQAASIPGNSRDTIEARQHIAEATSQAEQARTPRYKKPQVPSTPVSPVQKEGSGAMSSQGSGTPAFMAIPALGSPQQNGKSKANGSRPGRPIYERKAAIPAEDEIPPFREGAQASPPSFKGFLTDKDKAKIRQNAVLNTADIWKPNLADAPPSSNHSTAFRTGGASSTQRSTDALPQSSVGSAEVQPVVPMESKAVNGVARDNHESDSSSQDYLEPFGETENLEEAQPLPITRPLPKPGPLTRGPSVSEIPLTLPQKQPVNRSNGINRGNSLGADSPREAERGGLRRSLSGNPASQAGAGGDLYEFIRQLGSGNTGMTKLMKERRSGELVAAKWVPHTAGEMLSVQVEREILNHRRLLHSNVVRFREVFATDDHLVIVTDYASAGSLCNRILEEGATSERKAKDYFKQLVDGMTYCHRLGVVHRNLRLEKLLLDGTSASAVLKISGFAYSKAPALDSAPKSIVGGGPTYMAPEMLMATREGSSYDGRAMDVWSAGVCLYTILTGSLPFKDPNEPGILSRRLMQRIVNCIYEIPSHLNLSDECKDLISKILVPDPKRRIDSYALHSHPWLIGTTLKKASKPVTISEQSETDISHVMERARKRKEARLAAQKATARASNRFNEDLLDE